MSTDETWKKFHGTSGRTWWKKNRSSFLFYVIGIITLPPRVWSPDFPCLNDCKGTMFVSHTVSDRWNRKLRIGILTDALIIRKHYMEKLTVVMENGSEKNTTFQTWKC